MIGYMLAPFPSCFVFFIGHIYNSSKKAYSVGLWHIQDIISSALYNLLAIGGVADISYSIMLWTGWWTICNESSK